MFIMISFSLLTSPVNNMTICTLEVRNGMLAVSIAGYSSWFGAMLVKLGISLIPDFIFLICSTTSYTSIS